MARTPAQATLDEVIRLGLTPALKADGYHKDGHTFRRERPRCVQVLNVQSDRWSTASGARFTINLGVYFPEVRAVMDPGWEPGPGGPKEHECTVRSRIGDLMPGGQDHWWTVRAGSWLRPLGGTPPQQVADEVRAAYEDHGQPWLERMADLASALEENDRGGSLWQAAAMALVLGDEARARGIAERVLRDAPQATAVVAWARRRGLLP